MRGAVKDKPAETVIQNESVADRCKTLEAQIAEAAHAIELAESQLDGSPNVSSYNDLRGKIEFWKMQRGATIEERIGLEAERLAEQVDVAIAERKRNSPLPDLITKRDRAFIELSKIERDVASASFDDTRLHKAIAAAQLPLTILQSERPIDGPVKARMQQELRDTLEALNAAS